MGLPDLLHIYTSPNTARHTGIWIAHLHMHVVAKVAKTVIPQRGTSVALLTSKLPYVHADQGGFGICSGQLQPRNPSSRPEMKDGRRGSAPVRKGLRWCLHNGRDYAMLVGRRESSYLILGGLILFDACHHARIVEVLMGTVRVDSCQSQ